jgi:hypothetical protein
LQERFGGIVWSIYRVEDGLRQALTDANTLYASLAQRAFRGEL